MAPLVLALAGLQLLNRLVGVAARNPEALAPANVKAKVLAQKDKLRADMPQHVATAKAKRTEFVRAWRWEAWIAARDRPDACEGRARTGAESFGGSSMRELLRL